MPDAIQLRFQNTGNVHVTPRGTVKISDPLGRVIESGIINQQSSIELPETFRLFPTKLADLSSAFIPGRYNLNIAYRYDGKDDFSYASSSFFLIPPLFIVLLVIFVLLIAFLAYIYFKKKKKSSQNENGGKQKK
jgi:hypothetical protein